MKSLRPLPALRGLTAAACAACAALLMHPAAWAQGRTAAPLPPAEGEVIVAFKPEAGVLRKHALAARAGAGDVQAMLSSRAGTLGARLGRTLEAGAAVGQHTQVVRASGVDAATLARQLAADPDVLYAVPNGRKQRVAAPNDPLYAAASAAARPNGPASGQWYLRAPTATVPSAIDIEAAWAQSTGTGVVVAVLDTGVRFEHPDLSGQMLVGYDMVNDPVVANDGDGRDADARDPGDWITSTEAGGSTFSGCTVSPSSWHGTATSSLVAAATNNASGMAGVAPGAKVLPVRVLGKCFGNDSDILAGMRWAAGIAVPGLPPNPNPAKVINMSLGGAGACSAAYQAAVNEIAAAGVLIVAAAGNSAGGPVNEPANCAGVVGVLALRHAGTKVGFSDLGPEISIAAPGGNCVNITEGSACLYPILAATNSGTTGPAASTWTDSFNVTVGTSFSSPLVAGVAGILAAQRSELTPRQLRSALMLGARTFPTSGADNGDDPLSVRRCNEPERFPGSNRDLQCYCNTAQCGAGMLSAGGALTSAQGSRQTLSSPLPRRSRATSLRLAEAEASAQWAHLSPRTVGAWSAAAASSPASAVPPTRAPPRPRPAARAASPCSCRSPTAWATATPPPPR